MYVRLYVYVRVVVCYVRVVVCVRVCVCVCVRECVRVCVCARGRREDKEDSRQGIMLRHFRIARRRRPFPHSMYSLLLAN